MTPNDSNPLPFGLRCSAST